MNHSKIFKISISIFILVVLLIGGGYYYLTHTKDKGVLDNGGVGGLSTSVVNQNNSTSTDNNNGFGNSTTTTPEIPRLRKISSNPVSGADIFERRVGKNGSELIISFVDRGTGNIFEGKTNALDVTRITNTTIPRNEEALYGVDGKSVILRSLNNENIDTFLGKVSPKSTILTGTYFKQQASNISVSPNKNRFFFTENGINGSTWNISDFNGKTTKISSSPLTGWVSSWPNESTVVLTNKPSSYAGSVSYALNTNTKSFNKLYGPKNGLVTLPSPDMSQLLYSYTVEGITNFGSYNIKKSEELSYGVQTIADKCVWSYDNLSVYCGVPQSMGNGTYPDIWYQGQVSFADNLYSFDASSNFGSDTVLSNLQSEARESIDIINPKISKDGSYMIFMNKRDLSLWGFRIK